MTTPTTEPRPTEPTAKPQPKLDLRGMLERLKLPGIDTQKLLDSGRKDIEALLSANERAFTAIEELTRKQAEMFGDVVKEWQASAKDVITKGSSAEKINQAASHAQQAFINVLTAMKDMAEIAAKSTQEVVTILNKRYHDALVELRSSIGIKH